LALEGSAYTSLGALYYQVPGWPLAFGNKKQAEKLLLQALEINPDGIDSNYFWGDYLVQQKRSAEARSALLKAQGAPTRPRARTGRPWSPGRDPPAAGTTVNRALHATAAD